MHIKTKYFYTNDTEMKRGDLVYMKGGEISYGLEVGGIFEIIENN